MPAQCPRDDCRRQRRAQHIRQTHSSAAPRTVASRLPGRDLICRRSPGGSVDPPLSCLLTRACWLLAERPNPSCLTATMTLRTTGCAGGWDAR